MTARFRGTLLALVFCAFPAAAAVVESVDPVVSMALKSPDFRAALVYQMAAVNGRIVAAAPALAPEAASLAAAAPPLSESWNAPAAAYVGGVAGRKGLAPAGEEQLRVVLNDPRVDAFFAIKRRAADHPQLQAKLAELKGDLDVGDPEAMSAFVARLDALFENGRSRSAGAASAPAVDGAGTKEPLVRLSKGRPSGAAEADLFKGIPFPRASLSPSPDDVLSRAIDASKSDIKFETWGGDISPALAHALARAAKERKLSVEVRVGGLSSMAPAVIDELLNAGVRVNYFFDENAGPQSQSAFQLLSNSGVQVKKLDGGSAGIVHPKFMILDDGFVEAKSVFGTGAVSWSAESRPTAVKGYRQIWDLTNQDMVAARPARGKLLTALNDFSRFYNPFVPGIVDIYDLWHVSPAVPASTPAPTKHGRILSLLNELTRLGGPMGLVDAYDMLALLRAGPSTPIQLTEPGNAFEEPFRGPAPSLEFNGALFPAASFDPGTGVLVSAADQAKSSIRLVVNGTSASLILIEALTRAAEARKVPVSLIGYNWSSNAKALTGRLSKFGGEVRFIDGPSGGVDNTAAVFDDKLLIAGSSNRTSLPNGTLWEVFDDKERVGTYVEAWKTMRSRASAGPGAPRPAKAARSLSPAPIPFSDPAALASVQARIQAFLDPKPAFQLQPPVANVDDFPHARVTPKGRLEVIWTAYNVNGELWLQVGHVVPNDQPHWYNMGRM